MERTLNLLVSRVPPPQRVPFKDSFVFRYVERSIQQAIVQKLARTISSLYAADLLLEKGFLQEQGALQRMLDEFQEDVIFLSFGLILGEITPLHQQYLSAFYEEEFDTDDPVESTQKRPMSSRKKIRAYIANREEAGSDPSRGIELARTINKAYSGFIHGVSTHIMDMYGGNPPKFYVSGMLDTPKIHEHQNDLWSYFYRGILGFCFSAKAFGDENLFKEILNFCTFFERESGNAYTSSLMKSFS
jgi:hypothetical protein